MTKAFPAIMTQGIDEPCRFEGEVFDLEVVEGSVPTELDGLLVQAVPDQVFPPEVAVIHPMTIAAGGDGSGAVSRLLLPLAERPSNVVLLKAGPAVADTPFE